MVGTAPALMAYGSWEGHQCTVNTNEHQCKVNKRFQQHLQVCNDVIILQV